MADIMAQGEDVLIIDDAGGTVTTAAGLAVPVLDEDALAPELPKGAVRNDDGTVTYTLRFPRSLKYRRQSDGVTREEQIETLRFHRLTGGDMRAVAAVKSDMSVVVAIARSTRTNEARMKLVFDMLDGEDAANCGEIVSSFLGTGPKTGR